jgi:hypothetical protein
MITEANVPVSVEKVDSLLLSAFTSANDALCLLRDHSEAVSIVPKQYLNRLEKVRGSIMRIGIEYSRARKEHFPKPGTSAAPEEIKP